MTEEQVRPPPGEDPVARLSGFDGLAGTLVETAVLTESADAVVACDSAGRVVTWNPAAERLFGIPAAQAVGRVAAELLGPAGVEDAGVTRSGLFARSGDRVGELAVIRPVPGQLGRPEPGECSAVASSGRIAEVAHDMRQPLATIRYLIEAAAAHAGDSAADVNLDEINKHLEYLTELTEHLLGEPAAARAPVDLVALVNAAVATVRGESAGSGTRVDLVAPEGLIVAADAVALHRAIVNLVHNAVRAAGRGGQVRITLTRRLGAVRLDVEDSGPGLPVDDAPDLGGERSLGLFITERLVRSHGGHLVDLGLSPDLGGAAVRMLLPASDPAGRRG